MDELGHLIVMGIVIFIIGIAVGMKIAFKLIEIYKQND